jgi:predicted DNA binding CopG/RHH family protein
MKLNQEQLFLELTTQVAKKTGLNVETMQHKDFEFLSDALFEKTKIRISVSTLKRVFGKIQYEGLPQQATLDAL